MPGGAHDAADARAAGPTGRAAAAAGRRGTAARRAGRGWRGSSARAASSSADGPPEPRDQRAHLVDVGVDDVHRVGDRPALGEPPTGRERGAAHEPRRPDVAVHAALVAQAVHEARLAEELVELVAVLLGHLRAYARAVSSVTSAPVEVTTLDRDPDRLQQRVGELERTRLGDVEAVERAVADEVEVARRPRRRSSPGSARSCASTSAGSPSDSRMRIASGSSAIVFSRSSSSDPPADTAAEPRRSPSSSACEMPVQSPTCARKSPVGIIAAAV